MAVVKENIVAGIKISAIIYLIIVIIIVIDIVMSTKKVTLQIITLVSSTLPAIALLADGVNYLISAAALKLERDGINIECRSDDCSKGRIIIRVKNVGNDDAERVYAHLTVGVHRRNRFSWEWSPEKRELGDSVVNTNLCKDAIIRERNPRIDKEHLPWIAGNDKFRNRISIVKGDYARLLILEYERVPDYYVIKVPSSEDKPMKGKPMICLRLDLMTKYVFHITINGSRVRRSLGIKMYITMDRLDAIIQSKVRLERRFINEELFNVVPNELLIG
jgi:hypothetical protein